MQPIDIATDRAIGTSARPGSGLAISPREVAIPIAALEAGRLPAISVRSGEPASAATPVIHRPRLTNRGAAWGGLVIGDGSGCLLALVLLPTVFLLYPHSKWLTRALPTVWRATGVLPVTAGEAQRILMVQRGATATGLAAALLIAALIAGVPGSVAPLLGFTLFVLLVTGIVYASLPVGNLTTIAGQRVVILRGVHLNFATAIQRLST